MTKFWKIGLLKIDAVLLAIVIAVSIYYHDVYVFVAGGMMIAAWNVASPMVAMIFPRFGDWLLGKD